jgi:hypothetical protein
MNYKDVELINGKIVRVYIPPIVKTYEMARRKHKVEKPIVTETTKRGKVISMSIDDDPEYLAKLEVAEGLIEQEAGELNMLFALKDEEVPEDFNVEEYSDILLYADPEWKAREGKMGRKLDYIEWDLLSISLNMTRVQLAINELLGIDAEVVEATKESFQD